jgi:hypothetical protein
MWFEQLTESDIWAAIEAQGFDEVEVDNLVSWVAHTDEGDYCYLDLVFDGSVQLAAGPVVSVKGATVTIQAYKK